MSASTGGQIFDTLMNSVKPGEFHGLSYPAAARKILAKTDKHPLTTPQLMQIIEKSGRKVEGKNPLGTIYSSLSRNSDFQKVAENTWGLSEWYPSGAKKPSKVKLSEDEDMEESETQGERESQEKQE
jgi:DNA-directed RNA polymerase delta subunit